MLSDCTIVLLHVDESAIIHFPYSLILQSFALAHLNIGSILPHVSHYCHVFVVTAVEKLVLQVDCPN